MLIVVFIVVPVPTNYKQSQVPVQSNAMAVRVSRQSIIVHPVGLRGVPHKKDTNFVLNVLI
jgi:hypothetical protein